MNEMADDVWDPTGVFVSIRTLIPGAAIDQLKDHCRTIPRLTVYHVGIHPDHRRFVVRFEARGGAEKLIPRSWKGVPVVLERGSL